MRIKLSRITQFALVVTFASMLGVVQADEGTADPDFDYEPPEEIGVFGRFTNFVADLFSSPSHAGSYSTAKKRRYSKIEDSHTFYCDCTTDLDERKFDKTSCGYVPNNDNIRAKRLEAEHILPAFWIANFHTGESCWEAHESCGGARDCCLENDERFKKAHNDLVNLIPTIGELNGDRSNFIYDLIDGEDEEDEDYGQCDFEVSTTEKVAEPKDDIRGDIARVYFYMRNTYELAYPDNLAERLNHWNDVDPISDEEKERNQRIQDTQGSSNALLQ